MKLTAKQAKALGLSEAKPAKPVESEAQFQARVIELAHLHGWRCAHFRKVRVQRKNGSVYWETPAAADGVGFPDLVLVRNDRLIFAELKAGRNKTTLEQRIWLDSLKLAGAEVYEWRAGDEQWPEVMRVLAS